MRRRKNSRRRHRINDYLLSGLVRCTCGANMDGDSGFYRCHDRCGTRGIKKETLEQAVLDVLFDQVLTLDSLAELKATIEEETRARLQQQPQILDQLNAEYKEIERQINELVMILPKTKHQRPIIDRLDILEEERMALADRIDVEGIELNPPITKYDEAALEGFLAAYRQGMEVGSAENKKALLRSVIERGVFDGETLTLHPSYEELAGVKLASPRGVEPLSSP